jgi:hypothetical protein
MSGKGFGLKKALNLNSGANLNQNLEKPKFYKNIIFGEHFLIPKLLFLFQEKEESCLFLGKHLNFSKNLVESEINQYFYYPRTNEDEIANLGIELNLDSKKSDEEIKFYKDGKFHRFNTRVKPSALLEGEESFLNERSFINLKQLYSSEEFEKMDEVISKFHEFQLIKYIECIDPTDLIEKANFRITLTNDQEIECETLLWFDSPLRLEKLLSDKHDEAKFYKSVLTDNYALSSLQVNFILDNKFGEGNFTYFLPQSMMHEQGHYIVCSQDQTQVDDDFRVNSFLYLDQEDEFSEEDVAKKIKHFKSTLKRVLPELHSSIKEEEIIFTKDRVFKHNVLPEDLQLKFNQNDKLYLFFEQQNILFLLKEFLRFNNNHQVQQPLISLKEVNVHESI